MEHRPFHLAAARRVKPRLGSLSDCATALWRRLLVYITRKTCAIVPASGRSDVHQVARAVNVDFWLRRPFLLPSRVVYWLWEKMNPGKPWLCRGAVVYCERVLTKSMTAVEFGSGRSTAWFAKHVGRLTSVEHDSGWHSQVAATLERERIANVDYRLVPLGHPENEPEHATYEPLPAYVAVLNAFDDESLDLVVVDGHYRTTCIATSLSKLRPNGLLLVDDVNLWPSESAMPVPINWPLVNRSSNGIKRTCVWRKPRKER